MSYGPIDRTKDTDSIHSAREIQTREKVYILKNTKLSAISVVTCKCVYYVRIQSV